ncbi:MAG: hypothetical protein AMXMBFR6_12030 [Betaproteobacteria bacterium]|nr:DUF3460 family protein [Rhodocyclaceae bacterium]MCG3185561.1 hypothetical protein [Rhodocyclaceae bacterium]
MALYESEHTRFMREWLAQHPDELVEQKKGRALWWDRPQTLQRTEEVRDARVPQKPYYYLTD